MASTTFCDWCGELMGTRPCDDPAILRVAGRDDDGRFLFHAIAGGFNIHAERAGDGDIHPDCCLGQLEALLEERSRWAHDPEQEEVTVLVDLLAALRLAANRLDVSSAWAPVCRTFAEQLSADLSERGSVHLRLVRPAPPQAQSAR